MKPCRMTITAVWALATVTTSWAESAAQPASAAAPAPVPTATAPAAGDNSPSFRGPTGSGLYKGTAPTSWSESRKSGILWSAKLELPGWSSPIAWNDKVVVTAADATRRLVCCFDVKTGKETWKLPLPDVAGTSKAYKPDAMDSKWDEMLHAAATAATDGRSVFALFSNGQLAAIDLATGKHLWSAGLGETSGNKYGLTSSLLVSGPLLIAVHEGDSRFIAAYDAASGKEQWKQKRSGATWASPILVRTRTGADLIVLPADPDVTAWDARTGKQVWSQPLFTTSPEFCVGPSPVTDGERLYVNLQNNGIFALNPDNGATLWSIQQLPKDGMISPYRSMTTDGHLLYHLEESTLTIIDGKTGKVLASPAIDLTPSEASPMVVGNRLYLPCGDTMLVFTTGEKAGKIGEGSFADTLYASPAYAGGRIFARTQTMLYCIGQ